MQARCEGNGSKVRSARVLVVDDNDQARKTIVKIVGKGRHVVAVPSGELALDHLARGPVDFAVVDVFMPFMNGLELLRRIRQDWPGVRVALVSGLWEPKIQRIAIQCGAINFFDRTYEALLEIAAYIDAWERNESPPIPTDLTVELPTHEAITDAYYEGVRAMCGGNVSHAAETLDMHRTSLQRRLKARRERAQGSSGAHDVPSDDSGDAVDH